MALVPQKTDYSKSIIEENTLESGGAFNKYLEWAEIENQRSLSNSILEQAMETDRMISARRRASIL